MISMQETNRKPLPTSDYNPDPEDRFANPPCAVKEYILIYETSPRCGNLVGIMCRLECIAISVLSCFE